MINSLVGVPFKNKKTAEFLTKKYLEEREELKFLIEKDKYSVVYKVSKGSELLFHVIIKQTEEVERMEVVESKDDYNSLLAAEKCNLSLFIFKGKEDEFKFYAYDLLQNIHNYSH